MFENYQFADPEPPAFTFEIFNKNRTNVTSVGGREIRGGSTASTYSLTLDGGEGRSKVEVYMDVDRAEKMAKNILKQIRKAKKDHAAAQAQEQAEVGS